MLHKFAAAEAHELLKIPNQMALVVITVNENQVGPVRRGGILLNQARHRFLEP